MHPVAMLSDPLMALHAQPLPLVLAIVLATFVLEDVATVTVALLASRMVIGAELAVAALVVGTVGGDLALYFAARWAGGFAPVRRRLESPALRRLLAPMRRRPLLISAAARCMPGFRLPVFLAAGAVPAPLAPFAGVVLATSLLWTPALFLVAERVGMQGVDRFGLYGWAAALSVIALVWGGPRLARRGLRLGRRLRPESAA